MSLRLPCALGGDPGHRRCRRTCGPPKGEQTAGQREEEEARGCVGGPQRQGPREAAPARGPDPTQAGEVRQRTRPRSGRSWARSPLAGVGHVLAGWAGSDGRGGSVLCWGSPRSSSVDPSREKTSSGRAPAPRPPGPRPGPMCDQGAHTRPCTGGLQTDPRRTPYKPTQGQDTGTEAAQR